VLLNATYSLFLKSSVRDRDSGVSAHSSSITGDVVVVGNRVERLVEH